MTLQALTSAEIAEGKKTATEGLLWLNRYMFLQFPCYPPPPPPSPSTQLVPILCFVPLLTAFLNSGLSFTCFALRDNHTKTTEELGKSFELAYQETLKKYHGFAAKIMFSTAMKACPYRATFYPKLGDDQEAVMRELDEWLCGLEKVVKILNDEFEQITKQVKL